MTRRSLITAGAAASLAGLATLALGLIVAGPRAVLPAYLVGFAWTASVLLGALVLLMIGHVSGATWFVVMRRYVEAACAAVPLLIAFVLPLLVGMRWVYPWAAPRHEQSTELHDLLVRKHAYLNPGFFTARALLFVGSWSLLAWLLVRASVHTDASNAQRQRTRMRTIAGAALPWIGLSVTFAAFDWLMSVDPAWYSNAYGFYWFAGGFVGGVAVTVLGLAGAARAGTLPSGVDAEHFGAIGRVQFASVCFWAYIAFTQFLILWMADIPEEVTFYRARAHGGWLAVTVVLALGHFALPFLVLLQRSVTRRAPRLALVSAWLLVMHAVDTFWMIEPAFHGGRCPLPWLDLAAILALGGAALAVAAWRFGAADPVPTCDPLLTRSLEYRAK